MKAREALHLAKVKNENGDYNGALKILNKLYKHLPNNIDVLKELTDTLLGLGEEEKAIKAISRAIKIEPKHADLWMIRSWLFSQTRVEHAIDDIEQAISLDENNSEYRIAKANYVLTQGQLIEAHSIYQTIINKHPEQELELLEERASNLIHSASTDANSEEQVTDVHGACFSVKHLELAIDDYSALIYKSESPWIYYFKRANTYKQLQCFDKAMEDYDQALIRIDNKNLEEYGPLIRGARSECLEYGQGSEASTPLSSQTDPLIESISITSIPPQSNFSQTEIDPPNQTDAVTSNPDNEPLPAQQESDLNDPDDIVATNVARCIFNIGFEPEPELEPTAAYEHTKASQKYCDRVQQALSEHHFHSIGDYTPNHLNETFGKPALMRLFTNANGNISVSAYKLYPLWPGLLSWLAMRLLLQWKKPAIVEFETELSNRDFIVTNNAGSLDPFDYGPKIFRTSLKASSKTTDVLEAHRAKINDMLALNPKLSVVSKHSFEDLMSSQKRMREVKLTHRKNIDYVTELELKRLLKGKYDKFSEKVREKLNTMVSSIHIQNELSEIG